MSGSSRLRVAVVGCGIGGAAAALLLARQRHHVTIFEQAEELGLTGAGILLAPTGQHVLSRLGLLDQALAQGSKIQRLQGDTAAGKRIMDLRYRNLGTGLFGLGIHRGTLFDILLTALQRESVRIRRGWPVVSVNDSKVSDGQGRAQGPFDLIVIADGARSALRASLGVETRSTPYDYGALWVSAPNWGDFPDNILSQRYDGTRRMLGLLPSGRMPGEEGRRVSLFWSIAMRDLPDWRENGLARWKADVLKLLPEGEPLLEQILYPEQITIASYFDTRVWSTVKGNCVLIGDAAHASSPQLGQGASLALVDALSLSLCIEAEPNVMAALLGYRELRRRHARFYQLASKYMTPWFQSDADLLAAPRDLLLGPMCRVPWFQREMAATMAGIKCGPFARLRESDQVLATAAKLALVSHAMATPSKLLALPQVHELVTSAKE
jgi:2-polyprenyl-6-methoxyphenol hydroxylase-like FAD-dependent oxidoreductase